MEIEIRPEPSDPERAAILAALEQERAEAQAFVSELDDPGPVTESGARAFPGHVRRMHPLF